MTCMPVAQPLDLTGASGKSAAGVIGLPNVGKSSLINSLKRTRVAAVGNTPGVTKSVQEVHLDKNVKLLDSPGIVFSAGASAASALRNCVKVCSTLPTITEQSRHVRGVAMLRRVGNAHF